MVEATLVLQRVRLLSQAESEVVTEAPIVQEVMVAPVAAGTWTLAVQEASQVVQAPLVVLVLAAASRQQEVVMDDREVSVELVES